MVVKFLICLISVFLIAASTTKGDRVAAQEIEKPFEVTFMEVLKTLSPGDFTEIKRFEDVGGTAYFDSRHWMNLIFGASHDPHMEAQHARHYYHLWQSGKRKLDFDLLRHAWEVEARSVMVTESAGIIHVAVHLKENDQFGKLDVYERASSVANWLLHLPSAIRFVKDSSGKLLTSNLQHSERPQRDWKQSIYALSSKSMVEILIRKEDWSRKQQGPKNFSLWFEDEFRKKSQK